ncbi:histidine phosphatase family protein [Paenibacillus qinlingensis]|uniref:phosphoglycerate mutase (2,3-diphosphoglycerate-dependent) n=1 Tax=Paenibacillus qinlingensis TaxID=1837343 RepID=A0ABU1NWZ1_9BACL|nr:histidine phosphatase family protein [Paenibacillus qinlingensis]MDR6552012.1 broad specificity phosphatase PhoE [Paenibacillus qinlingensis]
MTRFYVMRHGESEWNRDGRYCGISEIPLSAGGMKQAEQAGEFLRAVKIDHVYASHLERAAQTAQPAAGHRKLRIRQDKRLSEIDFGLWEGLQLEEIKSRYSQEWQRWLDDPTEVLAGGTGESGQVVFDRMHHFFTEKAVEHPGEQILVTGHSTAIRIFIAGLLSMPLKAYRKLPTENAGIAVLDAKGDDFQLIRLNCRFDAF